MSSFLIIQTAFIGDVILATAVVEKLHAFYPNSKIDFLLRKGNEGLLKNNPHINRIITWDKKEKKVGNLLRISSEVRKVRYDYVINLHRFASSGFITFLSGSKNKIGFSKNPFSFCYTEKHIHHISKEKGIHEIERNHSLIASLTDNLPAKPKLYPSSTDLETVKAHQQTPYYCIAPASVWFTKQFPKEKWIELIRLVGNKHTTYLLGAPGDYNICEEIKEQCTEQDVINLSGKLSFLQSAALMAKARMNYVNDSAPLHITSAMNAPVTAIFCSTIPEFGFGPLSDNSRVIQVNENLYCRPCGIHGYKACPEGHFKCAYDINIEKMILT